MTNDQFRQSVIQAIRAMMRRNEPQDFETWLERNNDAIDDPGGNIIPSRVQANHDQYDNERHPFQ